VLHLLDGVQRRPPVQLARVPIAGVVVAQRKDMHWGHNEKHFVVLFSNCLPLVSLRVLDRHSLGVLLLAGVDLAVGVVLPNVHVVDQAWVKFPDWTRDLLLRIYPLDEGWNLLNHLFDLNTRLPLLEPVWQHVQQDIAAIREGLGPKLRLCDNQGRLEGVFVSEEDFEAKFVLLEFFGTHHFVGNVEREAGA